MASRNDLKVDQEGSVVESTGSMAMSLIIVLEHRSLWYRCVIAAFDDLMPPALMSDATPYVENHWLCYASPPALLSLA